MVRNGSRDLPIETKGGGTYASYGSGAFLLHGSTIGAAGRMKSRGLESLAADPSARSHEAHVSTDFHLLSRAHLPL
jgi:hypothetical protein